MHGLSSAQCSYRSSLPTGVRQLGGSGLSWGSLRGSFAEASRRHHPEEARSRPRATGKSLGAILGSEHPNMIAVILSAYA